jgi:hypothetical protein
MRWLRKLKRSYWTKLVNAESRSGEWDWFHPIVNGEKVHIKLVRFDENNHHLDEIIMTEESWKDLVHLIRRIT